MGFKKDFQKTVLYGICEAASKGGVEIKDRSYHLNSYKKCFLGNEMVQWLVNSDFAESEDQAIYMGQQCLQHKFIAHVVDVKQKFRNEGLFYKFLLDSGPTLEWRQQMEKERQEQEDKEFEEIAQKNEVAPAQHMRVNFQIKNIKIVTDGDCLDISAEYNINQFDAAQVNKQARELKHHTKGDTPGRVWRLLQLAIKKRMCLHKSLEDHPTKLRESEIYELSKAQILAHFDDRDDDGEPTAFRDVVRFYQDQISKKWLPKYAQINIKHYVDVDQNDWKYISEPYLIELSQFIGKKEAGVTMCLVPENSDIKLVQVNAMVSIRPSNSKVSSGEQYLQSSPSVAAKKQIKRWKKKLSRKDPEHLQIWNHRQFKEQEAKIKIKDYKIIDGILLHQKEEIYKEIREYELELLKLDQNIKEQKEIKKKMKKNFLDKKKNAEEEVEETEDEEELDEFQEYGF